jgi:hypothetical protein
VKPISPLLALTYPLRMYAYLTQASPQRRAQTVLPEFGGPDGRRGVAAPRDT